MRRPRGFTLIELVVALAVYALLAAALVVTLRNGIRTWERVERVSEQEQRVRFALDVLERDAARALRLTGRNDQEAPPLFTAQAIGFITAQDDGAAQLPRLERVLVRAETLADGTTALVRWSAPYPAPADGPLGHRQVLLAPIEMCRFAYLYADRDAVTLVWQPTWGAAGEESPALPRGIQLTLHAQTDPPLQVTYAYGIPTGALGQLGEHE